MINDNDVKGDVWEYLRVLQLWELCSFLGQVMSYLFSLGRITSEK